MKGPKLSRVSLSLSLSLSLTLSGTWTREWPSHEEPNGLGSVIVTGSWGGQFGQFGQFGAWEDP